MQISLTLNATDLEDLRRQATDLYTDLTKLDVAEWKLKTVEQDVANLTYQLEQITNAKAEVTE